MNRHGMGPPQGFWGLLTEADQAALLDLGRTSVFPPGATLFVEGDPATHLFILVDGWVKVLSVTRDGQELVLALRGHGDIIGEFAGETAGYRTATIQAISTVQSLIVGYEKFNSFLDTQLEASHAYRRAVTQRLSDTATSLRSRSVTTGAQRVAGLLVELAGRHGRPADGSIHLAMPLSQEDLASLAGTSRATVTRALANWRDRGFIRTGQRRIMITDLAGLRQAAGDRT
jgi:CRP/FNR family cyclic AMP-dependent transcriptional regulator